MTYEDAVYDDGRELAGCARWLTVLVLALCTLAVLLVTAAVLWPAVRLATGG
jgi:hypothetical protein